MSQEEPIVLLVTDSNPQSQLFVNYVHSQLDCEVAAIAPTKERLNTPLQRAVVLLDADHTSDEIMQLWHLHAAECESIVLAALNLRDEKHALETLTALHLQGVFYRHESLELICKGITTLLEGGFWMSRSLMMHLIGFYRRQQINSYRPVCGLTQREIEIIGLLGSGASNTEIADSLFVSEHTVKSHLYNIFRKIEVNNRIQAMNWARQNLGLPPPMTTKRNSNRLVSNR